MNEKYGIFEVRSMISLMLNFRFFDSLKSKHQDFKYSISHFQPPTSRISNSGQIAVVLLLFVLVALTIGLAVTQRSLSSITDSNQNEQSTRAFSAAEAGIESTIDPVGGIAITAPTGTRTISQAQLGNQSSATTRAVTRLPRNGQALEYPPIGKDTVAQFWLADPGNPQNPAIGYQGSSVYVDFGNEPQPVGAIVPAVEISLIYRDTATGEYRAAKGYYDPVISPTRRPNNGFSAPNLCNLVPDINTSNSVNPPPSLVPPRTFHCRVIVSIPASSNPIMLRVRILYADIKQPIAVEPVPGSCGPGANCNLPVQAGIYSSTGTSGQSQKTIQVFRETNFLPTFLDFAIFSSGIIDKP